MKFAIVNEQRQMAQPTLSGKCPTCESAVVAKCGEIKVWHWAHRGVRNCDPWWENETEWHRKWKGHFPEPWQEVVHRAESGEKHIADVLTDQGYVLEFQHSYIRPEERRAREAFYKKMVWVVDGTRRKRDKDQFLKLLEGSPRVSDDQPIFHMTAALDDCALLRDWGGGDAPVFFDFGESQPLFYILPKATDGGIYFVPVGAQSLVDLHMGGPQKSVQLDIWFRNLPMQVLQREASRRNPVVIQQKVFLPPRRPGRNFRF